MVCVVFINNVNRELVGVDSSIISVEKEGE
jgi:hypothetical protein